jgi:hypothetical protein
MIERDIGRVFGLDFLNLRTREIDVVLLGEPVSFKPNTFTELFDIFLILYGN